MSEAIQNPVPSGNARGLAYLAVAEAVLDMPFYDQPEYETALHQGDFDALPSNGRATRLAVYNGTLLELANARREEYDQTTAVDSADAMRPTQGRAVVSAAQIMQAIKSGGGGSDENSLAAFNRRWLETLTPEKVHSIRVVRARYIMPLVEDLLRIKGSPELYGLPESQVGIPQSELSGVISLYEAARQLGVDRWRLMRKVVGPLVKKGDLSTIALAGKNGRFVLGIDADGYRILEDAVAADHGLMKPASKRRARRVVSGTAEEENIPEMPDHDVMPAEQEDVLVLDDAPRIRWQWWRKRFSGENLRMGPYEPSASEYLANRQLSIIAGRRQRGAHSADSGQRLPYRLEHAAGDDMRAGHIAAMAGDLALSHVLSRMLEARPDLPRGTQKIDASGFPELFWDGATGAQLAVELRAWADARKREGLAPRLLPLSALEVFFGIGKSNNHRTISRWVSKQRLDVQSAFLPQGRGTETKCVTWAGLKALEQVHDRAPGIPAVDYERLTTDEDYARAFQVIVCKEEILGLEDDELSRIKALSVSLFPDYYHGR